MIDTYVDFINYFLLLKTMRGFEDEDILVFTCFTKDSIFISHLNTNQFCLLFFRRENKILLLLTACVLKPSLVLGKLEKVVLLKHLPENEWLGPGSLCLLSFEILPYKSPLGDSCHLPFLSYITIIIYGTPYIYDSECHPFVKKKFKVTTVIHMKPHFLGEFLYS